MTNIRPVVPPTVIRLATSHDGVPVLRKHPAPATVPVDYHDYLDTDHCPDEPQRVSLVVYALIAACVACVGALVAWGLGR